MVDDVSVDSDTRTRKFQDLSAHSLSFLEVLIEIGYMHTFIRVNVRLYMSICIRSAVRK